MLTSFIADESWVNHTTQMIFGTDSVKHYQFVELFTHKKLLVIDFVECERDQESGEEFEHHRKFLTSDTNTALKLIHDNQSKNLKLSSLGVLSFAGESYFFSTIEKIVLANTPKKGQLYRYHLSNGQTIQESLPVTQELRDKKDSTLFENNRCA
ncbi:MAG: hypothetical protein IE909_09970 [Campylobacterales bacterium]|nr:hypothetical protein [Campylobacterales bacterium]